MSIELVKMIQYIHYQPLVVSGTGEVRRESQMRALGILHVSHTKQPPAITRHIFSSSVALYTCLLPG
jgi:hypothetical protein